MTVRLGDIAPDFEAATTDGPLRFYDWVGDDWAILFAHPKDFTPVCTTELGRLARLGREFQRRGVKVLSLSVNELSDHRRWVEDIEETQGAELDFPLIADAEGRIAELYGMLDPTADDVMTVRSVFIIGPDKRVKLMLTYPASTGRNFDEILRVTDSLQLTASCKVATPADWVDGEDVFILPALSHEEASERFPGGWREIRPYMRLTRQPRA